MNKLEEAKETCRKIIKDNNEIVKQTRANKDINAMQLTDNCDRESLAIETVLQALEEITEERNTYRRQLNDVFDKGFIHKDKVKEVVERLEDKICCNDECLENRQCIELLRKIKNELLKGK